MTREEALQTAGEYFASGSFRQTQERSGFECLIVANPIAGKSPFLLARRMESESALTLLTYGHGDVVFGDDENWRQGLSPWAIVEEGNRWYGRGTADNKGQHTINLTALELVLAARQGRLGYNVKVILEMGEENGSPGLYKVCEQYRDWLAADLLIGSDGPRISAQQPTLFLGSRGVFNFDLSVTSRQGAHHSGNWGGLLSNPGIRLAHALACLVDKQGQIAVPALKPPAISAPVRQLLQEVSLTRGPDDPEIDPAWGEPGLSAVEKLYGWNTLDVLAFITGNPEKPAHAIPPNALAHCHMRYVVGSDVAHFSQHIRRHLDEHGFEDVDVVGDNNRHEATRLDVNDPWVAWALASMTRSSGKKTAILPNFGGALPNACFSRALGLPTLWVPHSYPACSQHAPDEHILVDVTREALRIMTGLFWDLAEQGPQIRRARLHETPQAESSK